MVTFETKVWEKDWEIILKTDYLDKMISQCDYSFSQKNLIINNVQDRKKVETFCKRKLKDKVIDSYFFAEDYAEESLEYFDINKDSFNGGYYYSIAELVGIYLCETDYLLHFSSDSLMAINNGWIDDAIKIFRNRKDVIVANPLWNNSFNEAQKESIEELQNFYISQGFSDQCYLIKSEVFKNKIYNENNPESNRYPKYGGELFEKRVDAYMRNNNLYRITSKNSSYVHKNFSLRSSFLEKISLRHYAWQRLRDIKILY